MLYFLIALLVLALDQASKWLIVRNLELHESIPVIGDFFQITSHRNTGAAFSILEGQRWFFLVITVAVVAAIVYFMLKFISERRRLLAFSLAFILGGAVGNFLDRLRFGEVVDFLKFRFQFDFFGRAVDYTFAIFNLADAAITLGVVLLVIDNLVMWRRERKEHSHEFHES